ncbi:ribose-5-phosphate isomerase RpiA [Listeria kieliensis]|uniref:Ribose-5-phosphate isomerase A n=1 Tax=Listeria kieliensis TaxID=1621700 RepID=A0A3D8TRX5_9LIST|nr:ribose-5-phosphate isomerase RpiA [Listeria kieliensis]RDX01492.1 ribose 5-phosphate isomerase [Listeria kieliensis]
MINMKKLAGEKACEEIKEGMVVGLGTGSTTFYAIEELGRRVRAGLKIQAVATSNNTEALAKERGIPLISLNDVQDIDLTIDGADEVDEALNGIKGGGGALFREKMVALHSKRNLWVIDETKLVSKLGSFPLPVEVLPFGYKQVEKELTKLNFQPRLRKALKSEASFVTDNGNYIFDLSLKKIKNTEQLAQKLDSISGILEHGLFLQVASELLIGKKDGTIEKRGLGPFREEAKH